MIFNLDRARLREASVIVMALGAFFSNDDLGEAWADAVENDPGSVKETAYRINAERAERRAKDKIGW